MATIYDVAQAAGVSPKTVSRVLNGDAPVNKDTRRSVEEAMARLNYVPSSAARTMRSHRSGLVGLVTGAISGEPAGGAASGLPDLQIVRAIQNALAEAGITLLISDTGGGADRIAGLVRTLMEHRVEGIFYVADHHQRVALPAAARHARLVLVNAFDDEGSPSVVPDDEHGQHLLVQALVASGHRRIGYLTLPESSIARGLRLQGHRRALEEAGIAYDPALIIAADHGGRPEEAAALSAAVDTLLALPEPPTVLCCANDRLAVAVYGILRARGIAVPGAMSVAGYDDYRVIAETLYPPLTTVELPYGRMGEAAARLMLARLRGEETPAEPQAITVRGALRWRASVIPAGASPTRTDNQRRNVA